MKYRLLICVVTLLSGSAFADTNGFLCCNMRTDGKWISDINYQEAGKMLISAGTPVLTTGYGKNRVHVTINDHKQDIGNDYSRSLALESFAARYIVEQDPLARLKTYPPKIQEAIGSARLIKGMNREQVIMSVGYPVSDENPTLDSKIWRYWLNSFAEFDAVFDDKGLLVKVEAEPAIRWQVVVE